MGMNFRVEVSGLDDWKGRTIEAVFRATKLAGTSALRAMRAEGSRRIREKKGIQASKIDQALSMSFPNTNRTSQINWTLIGKAKPLPLMSFGARQVGRGVSVEVTKGKRSIVKHAFIATMQSGHVGVFMRRGEKQIMRKGRYKGEKKQPIYERFSASVAPALKEASPMVLQRGASVFRDTFNRVLRSGR
jgi:hypothetical protein